MSDIERSILDLETTYDQILEMVGLGYSNKEIAKFFNVKIKDIKTKINEARDELIDNANKNVNLSRAQCGYTIDKIIQESYKAFTSDLYTRIRNTYKFDIRESSDGNREEVLISREVHTESTKGDPRLLSVLQKATITKAELHGLIGSNPNVSITTENSLETIFVTPPISSSEEWIEIVRAHSIATTQELVDLPEPPSE